MPIPFPMISGQTVSEAIKAAGEKARDELQGRIVTPNEGKYKGRRAQIIHVSASAYGVICEVAVFKLHGDGFINLPQCESRFALSRMDLYVGAA